ncbi:MAG: ATP-binding protein [Defluviicoccus sp.]|nr:ATP-binding protein [Defluviicoccus sp.]
MLLKQIILNGFRGYRDETRIDIDPLTAFIGVNDIGKSTILEALEIFFNSQQVKIDRNDLCVSAKDKFIIIGCVFSNLPKYIIIDATASTNLAREHLLNATGDLEIQKKWDFNRAAPREEIFANAMHPSADTVRDLLALKISDLKSRAREIGVDTAAYDGNVKHSIRNAIRKHVGNLDVKPSLIPLKDEDAKRIWEVIRHSLPIYALFRADRASTDADAEVQDPMKVAVDEALRAVEKELDSIKNTVKTKATEVAERTIKKINEVSPALAQELVPHFDEPKWANIFKLRLTGDNQIPINKRGSGTRRLILLSFFRAEAERLLEETMSQTQIETGIIYGIEEPETAQHPDNQRRVIEALKELSYTGKAQVLLTTHVPGLAGLIPISSVRYLTRIRAQIVVQEGESVLPEVAASLGVLPDMTATDRAKVILFVEGQRDIDFLSHVSATLHVADNTIPSIGADERIITCPVGGTNLKDWVFNNYLRGLGKPEIHVYDRDMESPPKYQGAVDEVNQRQDRSKAFLTRKREIENYIHPNAIRDVLGVNIVISDTVDVPEEVARDIHLRESSSTPWSEVKPEKKKEKIRRAKIRLCNDVARRMTVEQIDEADNNGEIRMWLAEIQRRLLNDPGST